MKPTEVQRRIAEIEECLDDNKCPTNTPRILERALEALKALAPPADLAVENERLRQAIIDAEAKMLGSKMRELPYASDATQPAVVVTDAMVERACRAWSAGNPWETGIPELMRAALTAALGPDPLAAPTPATKPAKQNA